MLSVFSYRVLTGLPLLAAGACLILFNVTVIGSDHDVDVAMVSPEPSRICAVDEQAPDGTIVVNSLVSDLLREDFRIDSGNDQEIFDIDSTTGSIRVAAGRHLDYETQSVVRLVISGRWRSVKSESLESDFHESLLDSGLTQKALNRALNRRRSVQVTIHVRNINEPPRLEPQTFTVTEAALPGDIVGTVVADDTDHGDSLRYALAAGADSGFVLDSQTGAVSLAASTALDYETHPCCHLIINVTDAAGLVTQSSIDIVVTDVNEPPVVLPVDAAWTVASRQEPVVGTIQAADADDGAELSFELADDPTAGGFALDQHSGVLKVSDFDQLWGLDTNQCTLAIRVRDDVGHVVTTSVDVSWPLPPVVPAVAEVPPAVPEEAVTESTSDESHSGVTAASAIRVWVNLVAWLTSAMLLVAGLFHLLRRRQIQEVTDVPAESAMVSDEALLELIATSENCQQNPDAEPHSVATDSFHSDAEEQLPSPIAQTVEPVVDLSGDPEPDPDSELGQMLSRENVAELPTPPPVVQPENDLVSQLLSGSETTPEPDKKPESLVDEMILEQLDLHRLIKNSAEPADTHPEPAPEEPAPREPEQHRDEVPVEPQHGDDTQQPQEPESTDDLHGLYDDDTSHYETQRPAITSSAAQLYGLQQHEVLANAGAPEPTYQSSAQPEPQHTVQDNREQYASSEPAVSSEDSESDHGRDVSDYMADLLARSGKSGDDRAAFVEMFLGKYGNENSDTQTAASTETSPLATRAPSVSAEVMEPVSQPQPAEPPPTPEPVCPRLPREQIRRSTPVFREIAKRAADAAIESASQQKNRDEEWSRIRILGLLLLGSSLTAVGWFQAMDGFATLMALFLAGSFCSATELLLHARKRGFGTRQSATMKTQPRGGKLQPLSPELNPEPVAECATGSASAPDTCFEDASS